MPAGSASRAGIAVDIAASQAVIEADIAASQAVVEAAIAASQAAIEAAILADMVHPVCSMDFWGATIEELQLGSAVQANLALTGADVTIAGIPAGATLVRVVVMFLFRALENTNAAANKLQDAQNIQVNFGGGAFASAIALADDLFGVAASTREMGTVVIGAIDVKTTVTGNGACTFRIDAARADQDNLNFNDYQCGIRVYFTV